jgi:hypothetical protein
VFVCLCVRVVASLCARVGLCGVVGGGVPASSLCVHVAGGVVVMLRQCGNVLVWVFGERGHGTGDAGGC